MVKKTLLTLIIFAGMATGLICGGYERSPIDDCINAYSCSEYYATDNGYNYGCEGSDGTCTISSVECDTTSSTTTTAPSSSSSSTATSTTNQNPYNGMFQSGDQLQNFDSDKSNAENGAGSTAQDYGKTIIDLIPFTILLLFMYGIQHQNSQKRK